MVDLRIGVTFKPAVLAPLIAALGVLRLCCLPLRRLQHAPKVLAACLLAVGTLSFSTGAGWGLTAAQRLFSKGR